MSEKVDIGRYVSPGKIADVRTEVCYKIMIIGKIRLREESI